jgi:hypothetical protein
LYGEPHLAVGARTKTPFYLVSGNFGLGELGAAILRERALGLILNDGELVVRSRFFVLTHRG